MIQGVFTALATPFNQDGTIDLGTYKAIVQWQLEQGVDGLVPVGTTGESPTLEPEEKELLIRTAVEATGGKVPVIAGTGANNTRTTIASTVKARQLGADMTLQVAPYYNKPSEEGGCTVILRRSRTKGSCRWSCTTYLAEAPSIWE
jgi:4-hydroxy-tetrahydrodipicolinate synthase